MRSTEQKDIGINQYLQTSGEEYCGEFHPYSDSVLFSHELVINGYRFFPGNCYKENGETALVHNIPVVVEIKRDQQENQQRYSTAYNFESRLSKEL